MGGGDHWSGLTVGSHFVSVGVAGQILEALIAACRHTAGPGVVVAAAAGLGYTDNLGSLPVAWVGASWYDCIQAVQTCTNNHFVED